MAKAKKRKMRSVPRGTRPRPDWVYRNDARAVAGLGGSDDLGTYSVVVKALTSGVVNALGMVLYDSANRMQANVPAGAGQGYLSRAARAEGRKPHIRAVEGLVYLEPTAWALGNLIAYGSRILIAEQDIDTGVPVLDAEYSMWANGLVTSASLWANQGRQNVQEKRLFYGFSDNQAFTVARYSWTGLRALEPHEALFLYMELETTSVNVRFQPFLRTLVSDEG